MRAISNIYEYESRSDDTQQIVALGDIHRGSRGMDEKRLYNTLEYIQEHECPTILMGDYGEFISKDDRRHDYAGISFRYLTARQQYQQIKADLEPISKYVVALLAGNHEYTYWRNNDIDWANWLAAELDVPYAPDFAYIRFKWSRKTGKSRDRKNLNVLCHHGWTNARTDGYKIKVIHDMKQVFPGCHIYLMGHVHRLGEALPTTHLWVDNRYKIREFTQHYFFTGSYVKNYEATDDKDESFYPFSNYAARKGYAPATLGSPIIHARPNRVDDRRDKTRTPFSVKYETLEWLT